MRSTRRSSTCISSRCSSSCATASSFSASAGGAATVSKIALFCASACARAAPAQSSSVSRVTSAPISRKIGLAPSFRSAAAWSGLSVELCQSRLCALGVRRLGPGFEQRLPRGALFGAAPQPFERKRATHHRLFSQGAAARARQITVELDQSTARITQSVEQQSPERDPRDKLFTRTREAFLQSAVKAHGLFDLTV